MIGLASELFLLDPLPPAPDGPLTISIRCSTVRANGPGKRHDITINPDWTITTPHDLDLERIATAMGGYLSCLEFGDHTLPALYELVQLHAPPLIARGRVGPDLSGRPAGLPCSGNRRHRCAAVRAGRSGRAGCSGL